MSSSPPRIEIATADTTLVVKVTVNVPFAFAVTDAAQAQALVSARLLHEGRGHEPVAQEVRDGAETEGRVDALPRVAVGVARRAGGGVVVYYWAPAFWGEGNVSLWSTGWMSVCLFFGEGGRHMYVDRDKDDMN